MQPYRFYLYFITIVTLNTLRTPSDMSTASHAHASQSCFTPVDSPRDFDIRPVNCPWQLTRRVRISIRVLYRSKTHILYPNKHLHDQLVDNHRISRNNQVDLHDQLFYRLNIGIKRQDVKANLPCIL
jgi:hypothetical protein